MRYLGRNALVIGGVKNFTFPFISQSLNLYNKYSLNTLFLLTFLITIRF